MSTAATSDQGPVELAARGGTSALSSQERSQLDADFVRLCQIESPSLREHEVAEYLAFELRSLGFDVEEDSSASATGSDCGNLIARLPAPEGARTILLCAHMDTVPLAGPVDPICEDGRYANRHDAILGADNKAAVAVILGVARRLSQTGAPVGLELLFTTGEELALRGVKEVDRANLKSEFGYVFDHASPIGELITGAPTYYRLHAIFQGTAAHAGIRPEAGRSAIAAAAKALDSMALGRVDEDTTTNAGTIEGGTASNVVAEECRVELEARSLDDDRAGQVIAQMVDACTEAASAVECDVETVVEQLFRSYRLARTAPVVEVASKALADNGFEPVYRPTGGGSDGNVLIAAGLPTLNVANGTERNHQPDESVTVEALEQMLAVAFSIVDRAAEA